MNRQFNSELGKSLHPSHWPKQELKGGRLHSGLRTCESLQQPILLRTDQMNIKWKAGKATDLASA